VEDEVRREVKGQKSRLESVAKCLVTRMKQKASGRCKEEKEGVAEREGGKRKGGVSLRVRGR